MSTSTQQIVLLELKANAKQAIAEYDRLKQEAMELKRADELVKAAGDEHKESLVRQKHALQDAAEEAKKAKSAMKDMEQAIKENKNSADDTAFSFGNLTKSITVANLASGAITKALEIAKDAVVAIWEAGINWEDNIGSLGPRVLELSEQLDGLIPAETIARTYELGKAQGWTEEQTMNVMKASIEYGRIARVDTKEAVDKVTDALINGEVKALRMLGINLDDISGNKTEKMLTALQALSDKYKDTKVKAGDVSEQHDKLKNNLYNLTAQLGLLIVKSDTYIFTIDSMSASIGWLLEKTIKFNNYLRKENKKTEDEALDGIAAFNKTQEDTAKWIAKQKQDQINAVKLLVDTVKLTVDEHDKLNEKLLTAKEKANKAYVSSEAKKNADLKKERDKASKELIQRTLDDNAAIAKINANADKAEKKRNADHKKDWAKVVNGIMDINKAYQEEKKQTELEALETKKEYYRQEATLIADQIAMNIINAKSFEDFTRKTLATAITALGQKASFHAMGEAAAALAALALTWGVPNQASAGHFASAAGWTALAIAANAGSGLIANAISGSSGGSISSDMVGGNMNLYKDRLNKDYSGFRESSSEFNSPNSRSSYSQGGSQTNVYIKGRMPLMSRRELKSIMGKLNSGRVA